ncbi:MAG: hypothetical protein JXO44_01195 [Clostridia bacterium]|nr:hypothetical protein [Clostridia bacterium]
MSRLGIILVLAGVGYMFITMLPSLTAGYRFMTYNYFTQMTFLEAGAENYVTGIYLEYRLFDSLFEAAILFVVAAGILFMSRKDEERL